jgi:hypothetical protein
VELTFKDANGVWRVVTRDVFIVDCTGDKPTCEEYYANNFDENELDIRSHSMPKVPAKYKLIDLMGRLVTSGNIMELNDFGFNHLVIQNGLYLLVKLSEEDEAIETEKIVIMK